MAPEILIESGQEPGIPLAEAKRRLQAGLDLAKEGAANNPKSGLLLGSYAELLFTRGAGLQAALPYAKRALASDIVWRTDEEQWDAMAILRAVFTKNGLPDLAAGAQAIMDAIDANPNATMNPARRLAEVTAADVAPTSTTRRSTPSTSTRSRATASACCCSTSTTRCCRATRTWCPTS